MKAKKPMQQEFTVELTARCLITAICPTKQTMIKHLVDAREKRHILAGQLQTTFAEMLADLSSDEQIEFCRAVVRRVYIFLECETPQKAHQ